MLRGPEDDITAAPAVTAVGTAEFHKSFAAERHRSVTAPAGTDKNLNLIYE